VKKFFVFLCVLILSVGIAVADDIGLTAGLEFGIGNVNKADDGDWEPYLMPYISYDKSFFDDALDFSIGLDYTFGFTPDFKDPSQTLGVDISVNYSLSLGSASTLSFYLANRNDVTISPKSDDNITGTLTPGVKFSQEMGIGSLYARVRAPIDYKQEDKDADMAVGLKSRLGWDSTFGLGIWAQLNSDIAPTFDFYQGVDANVSYGTDLFSFDVTASIGKELSAGISIEPYFEYYFGSFTFYIDCAFDGIAANSGGVTISPCIGVTFSF